MEDLTDTPTLEEFAPAELLAAAPRAELAASAVRSTLRFAPLIGQGRQRAVPVARNEHASPALPPRHVPENHGIVRTAPKFLIGEREHRLYPMHVEKVDYIESDGNYVTLRSGNSKYISRDSLKRLTADLVEFGFIRIERSLLLNIRAVAYVEPVGRGTFSFTLSSGTCLHSSASYRDSILRTLPMRRFSGRRASR